MQKYTVTLTKTIHVQVTAENMYDLIDQVENHEYCKEQGYMIKTADLMEDQNDYSTESACTGCKKGGN